MLNPAIDTLGIGAPYLGPWFDDANLRLVAPDTTPGMGDLSVTVTPTQPLPNATLWLPPCTGVFSLHVSTIARPPVLARLRRPDHSPAFADNCLIALYTLLPEVADRLEQLSSALAAPDGSLPGGAPLRARVHCLALEFADNNSARLQDVLPLVWSAPPWDNFVLADAALHFGLQLSADGLSLDNGAKPMADLYRPGKLPLVGSFEPLMMLQPNDSFRLHAFDSRGRPLDAGAVAAWWNALGTQHNDLWASGLHSNLPGNIFDDRRTAPVDPALSLHLVNAHEGPLPATLWNRLDLDTAGVSNLAAIDGLHTVSGGSGVTLQFLDNTEVRDAAPLPRLAALPSGRHAATLKLWATGAATPLARDFVRVALVELEGQLVGQSRVAAADASVAEQRRANNQQRWTTRVRVAPSQGPALLDNVDDAAAAVLGVFSGTNAQLVANGLDEDFGPLPNLGAGVDNLPNQLGGPNFSAKLLTLHGGDANLQSHPKRGQRALLLLQGLPAGHWLRAWPVGFDLASGNRSALTGGAGLVDPGGQVAAVVELPDGAEDGLLGIRVALTAPSGRSRNYTELRLPRPNASGQGHSGLPFGQPASKSVLLCEQGRSVTLPLPPQSVDAGTTVVEFGAGGWTLIDRSTLPAAMFGPLTLAALAQPGDTLELTQPAFRRMPDGTVGQAGFPMWLGATLHRVQRSGLDALTDAGQPFASQERLDQAVVSRAPLQACVWTAPALSRYHERGTHHSGHPGCPAAVEIHGTGVALSGAAAALVAEHVDDRIAKEAHALVTLVTNTPAAPPAPPNPNLWAAVLRTVAASVEGERGFGDKVHSVDDVLGIYRFEPVLPTDMARPYQSFPAQNGDIKKWYDDRYVTSVPAPGPLGSVDIHGTRLPDATGWPQAKVDAAKRAMDRRALAAGWGLCEALPSVVAAIARAEDFIYIETPALDLAPVRADGQLLALALMTRLQQRPLLRVILCVPAQLMPGWPAGVELTRNRNLKLMLGSLSEQGTGSSVLGLLGADRLAVFSPSAGQGRDLRLSATTVIVDDAYALTGSTHLWRRGLSFDSSLAVAVFDEQLSDGRPAEIRALRRRLIARQLSLPLQRVPDDPVALAEAVHRYNQVSSARVGSTPLRQPALNPPVGSPAPDDQWNPDGSWRPDGDVLGQLYSFLALNQDELAG